MTRFLGALQFLTVLPIRQHIAPAGDSAIFFPIVGGLLGLSASGVQFFLAANLGRSLGALLAIGWLLMVTGCLHEDGLADVADAFRVGRSREKIMSILKDSRIGTYGGLALAMSIVIRWQALSICSIHSWRGLVSALALSRAALVVLAHVTPPVGEGLARAFAIGSSRPMVWVVIVQAVALSFLAGWQLAILMLVATGMSVFVGRLYFLRRLGGVNGDCLGATCQISEMANLLVLAWRFSI